MYMTNPQVPYSRILMVNECFGLSYVKGLLHLLECVFEHKTIIKGWKRGKGGWVGLGQSAEFKANNLHLYLTNENMISISTI